MAAPVPPACPRPAVGAAPRPAALHMQMRHGGGRPRAVPPVGPLGPGRRSHCLLSRSLFLCAAFRGIKADTVVTRSPAGQRSAFTIPITMISNDVYLEGSDGRELYKRAPLSSPPLSGLRARRCPAPRSLRRRAQRLRGGSGGSPRGSRDDESGAPGVVQ